MIFFIFFRLQVDENMTINLCLYHSDKEQNSKIVQVCC